MAQQEEKNDALVALVVLAIVALAGYGIWYFLGTEISSMIRWVRYGELWVVSQFVDDPRVDQLLQALKVVPAERIGIPDLKYMTEEASYYLKYPTMGLLAILMLWVYFAGPEKKYRRIMGLEDLIKVQSEAFPVISPIVKFNPIDVSTRTPGDPVPTKLPLFAEALSPEEWIAFHAVPYDENLQIDRQFAREAFLKQLGPRWRGAGRLPMYVRALYAAFALKAARKREDSDKLLGEVSKCWSPKKGLVLTADLRKKINKIIADPKLSGNLHKEAAKHAYRASALMAVLEYARREGGVLAPAQFLWLRGQDRGLWYPLNNLGRRSFHTEAAAAMAHYIAEVDAALPIPTPKIDSAIEGVSDYTKTKEPTIPPRQFIQIKRQDTSTFKRKK